MEEVDKRLPVISTRSLLAPSQRVKSILFCLLLDRSKDVIASIGKQLFLGAESVPYDKTYYLDKISISHFSSHNEARDYILFFP